MDERVRFRSDRCRSLALNIMVETLKTADWFHADGFPIAVEPRNPQPPFGLHNHEFCEVVVITGGRGLHVTGKEAWTIAAGDAFVITGKRPHTYQDMDRLALVNILYQPERIFGEESDLASLPGYHALFRLEPAWRSSHEFKSRLHLDRDELATVSLLIRHLEDELRTRASGFRCAAMSLFMQIVCFLSRCYGRSTGADSKALLRIAEAISELETNYHQPIDLEKLAAIAQMTKRSLLRAFQKALGVSPISYLIRVRIMRACELLQSEDVTITEAAFRVGFEDSNYFTRQFHAITGTTPSAFRRQISRPQRNASRPRRIALTR